LAAAPDDALNGQVLAGGTAQGEVAISTPARAQRLTCRKLIF
jgi:hypothetical protein